MLVYMITNICESLEIIDLVVNGVLLFRQVCKGACRGLRSKRIGVENWPPGFERKTTIAPEFSEISA